MRGARADGEESIGFEHGRTEMPSRLRAIGAAPSSNRQRSGHHGPWRGKKLWMAGGVLAAVPSC
jgi:hypothetical protein